MCVCVCVCQFTKVLCLAGHEDWVRDVQFCQESKQLSCLHLHHMYICLECESGHCNTKERIEMCPRIFCSAVTLKCIQ